MDQNALWSERFRAAGEDYLFGITPNRFLAHRADRLREGRTALSVADGEGRNSVWLAEQGLNVTAIEITEVGVAKAQKLAAGRNVQVRFEIGDILAPDWPPVRHHHAYDWVVGIFIQFAGSTERTLGGGALSLTPTAEGLILVTGQAAWARVRNGDDALAWDCDVSDLNGSGELKMPTTQLYAGGFTRIVSGSFV